MAIGYEIELRRKEPLPETLYENDEEELSSIIEKAQEFYEKKLVKTRLFF